MQTTDTEKSAKCNFSDVSGQSSKKNTKVPVCVIDKFTVSNYSKDDIKELKLAIDKLVESSLDESKHTDLTRLFFDFIHDITPATRTCCLEVRASARMKKFITAIRTLDAVSFSDCFKHDTSKG